MKLANNNQNLSPSEKVECGVESLKWEKLANNNQNLLLMKEKKKKESTLTTI